ncbi:diguanylate cyclase [Roseateles sp. DAIF2]|uniref:sensor domain-containing diguanylate cyclase n=1 Tax=Roseateles sp. DAIF2 TaxID=2714952 RepID=UPI0018A3103D|nr:diguanylate cyclase [Roseateles sp. DAIF2]QPF71749.1 diguanylate cyclase [Roseateles sp. DAIF2]
MSVAEPIDPSPPPLAATSAPRGDRLRLGSWLSAAVLSAVLLAVLGYAALIGSFARANAERGANEALRQIAVDFRDALDRGMAQQFREVKVLSQLELFQHHEDPAAMRRALNQIQLGLPQFAWMGVTDAEGKVLASGGGLLEGVNVSKRPWWQNALQGIYVGDVHAAVLLEKLLPQQNDPWRFVDFAWPLRNERGQVLGVFGVHLSWGWARQIKSELIDAAMESHEAEALVIGKDGTVLLGPPALEGKKLGGVALEPGPASQVLRYTEAGVDYFAVAAATRGQGAYTGLGWTVLLRKPEALALADYHRLRLQIIVTALVLMLLSVPLARWLSRRLTAPLVRLANAIAARRHLGEGGQMPHVGGYREVALLSDALGDLSRRQAEQDAALAGLNASLEQRVAQRTQELQQALAQLQAGERRLRMITDNLPALISYIDRDQRLLFLNATFQSWMGLDPRAALGRRLPELLSPGDYSARQLQLARALAGQRVDFEIEVAAAAGEGGAKRLLRIEYIPDLLDDGTVAGLYTLGSDITAAKLVEQHLDRLTRTDALTGGPNRRQLEERLPQALARARRSRQDLALLFLDIDKFKDINDGLGHAAGDAVLREFARRLTGCVRGTDLVARLAGDEFVIVLEGLREPAEAELVARKVLEAMQPPFALPDGPPLPVSTSVGVAYDRAGAATPEALMESADRALYEAKAAGRGSYRLAGAA